MNMDVSIIIVNYNTCILLKQCIESVIQQTKDISYEIIVVDNASLDASCEMLKVNFSIVKLIKSKVNLGFGKANNLGIEHSSGKYLFFLNSDTILLNNAVKLFFDFSEKNLINLGAVGAVLKDIEGDNIHSYGEFIKISTELKMMLYKYMKFLGVKSESKYLYPCSVDEPLDVDYITGADLFVPRNVYEKTGAFDPIFFMYCEEVDWQYRMYQRGFRRLIINGPLIIHLEGGSAPTNSTNLWSFNRTKNIICSKLSYVKKYYNYFPYCLFRYTYAFFFLPILVFVRKDKWMDKFFLIRLLLFKYILK